VGKTTPSGPSSKTDETRETLEMVPAYVSIRQHTSAYVSIRQHTPAYVSRRDERGVGDGACSGAAPAAPHDVSIRQHSSAYVSIRQHTSAYVSACSAAAAAAPHDAAEGGRRLHFVRQLVSVIAFDLHTLAYVSMRQRMRAVGDFISSGSW
jgi:hypothetical protein